MKTYFYYLPNELKIIIQSYLNFEDIDAYCEIIGVCYDKDYWIYMCPNNLYINYPNYYIIEKDMAGAICSIIKGANVNKMDGQGQTSIFYAVISGSILLVKFLQLYGANIHHLDNYNQNPLLLAAFNGHFNIVKYLVEQGADINNKTTLNQSVLDLVDTDKHPKVYQYLKSLY